MAAFGSQGLIGLHGLKTVSHNHCTQFHLHRSVTRASSSSSSSSTTSMLAKLGQRFNSAGIISTLNVVTRDPQAALPHLTVQDISCLDWQALKDGGFQGVVLDKDNTITAPYAQAIWPSLVTSIEDCKKTFKGRVAILSNSAGLYQYDPEGLEAKALEDLLGISVIRHGAKKPSGSAEELEKHFGCEASSLIMVGDRIFTDIVYGNKIGLLTVFTKPLTSIGEPFVVGKLRALEELLVQRYFAKGITPRQHKLLSSNNKFVRHSKGG